MAEPLYSIGEWEGEDGFMPVCKGGINVPMSRIRKIMTWLRKNNIHHCRRKRLKDVHLDRNGMITTQYESDPFVIVERTDGKSEAEIIEMWKR